MAASGSFPGLFPRVPPFVVLTSTVRTPPWVSPMKTTAVSPGGATDRSTPLRREAVVRF
jgi:hypothetical protein